MLTAKFPSDKRISVDRRILTQAGGRWFGVSTDDPNMLMFMPFGPENWIRMESPIRQLVPSNWDLLIFLETGRFRLTNTGDINAFRITCESREVRMEYSAVDLLVAFEEVLLMARLPYNSPEIIEWVGQSEQAQAFLAQATSKSDLRTLAKVYANEQLTRYGGNDDDRRAARVAMGPYERDFWQAQNMLRPTTKNGERVRTGDIVGMSLDGRPAPQVERVTIKKRKGDNRPAHGQKRAYFDD